MAAYIAVNDCRKCRIFFYVFVFVVALMAGLSLAIFPLKIVAGILALSLVFALLFLPVAVDASLVRVAFYLSIFLSIVWPRYISIPGTHFADLTPSRIAILFMVLGAIKLFQSDSLARSRFSYWYGNNRLLANIFFVYVLSRFLSGLFSIDLISGCIAFVNEFVSYYVYFFVVPLVVESDRDLRRLFYVVASGFFVVLCVAVAEWVIGHNLFSSLVAADSEYLENILRDKIRGGGARVQATFVHPLSLAEFVIYSFPVILVTFFSTRRLMGRSFLLMLLVSSFLVVYLTGSRAGLAISVVMLLLYWLFASINNGKTPFGLLALFALLPFLAMLFFEYDVIGHIKGQSLGEYRSGAVRIFMLERSFALALEHPFLGYGLKTAANVLGVVGAKSVVTIDSFYLSLLLDSGFLGLFLYLLLSCVVIFRFSDGNMMLRFLIMGLCSVLVFKAISSSPYNDYLYFVFISIVMLSRIPDNGFKTLREKV